MVSRAGVITSWTSAYPNLGDLRICEIAAFAMLMQAAAGAAQSMQAADPVRASMTVDAEEACATAAALAEQVHERSRRIEFVDDAGDVPSLRIAISAAGARDRVAVLSVQWPDGQRSERRLTARSCDAAVDALGLLIAMTLDPAALVGAGPDTRGEDRAGRGRAGPGAEAGAEAGPGAGAGAEAGAGAGTDPAPSPNPSPSPSPNPNPEPDTDSNADVGAAHPLGVAHVAAGISAQLVTGPAPSAMPGFGLYARLALNGTALWAPAIEVQLARTWVDGLSAPGGEADFALETAQLAVCPLGLQLAAFSAFSCMTGEVGRLIARGSRTYAPQTHREPWTSLGAAVLLSLGLGALLEVEAGFGVAGPLRRDRFSFQPDVFHEVAGARLSAHLGAGMRFP